MTQIRSMGLNKNIENNQSFLTRNRSESSEKFISIKYPYNKFLIYLPNVDTLHFLLRVTSSTRVKAQ